MPEALIYTSYVMILLLVFLIIWALKNNPYN